MRWFDWALIVGMLLAGGWYMAESLYLGYILRHPQTWRPEVRESFGLPPISDQEGESE